MRCCKVWSWSRGRAQDKLQTSDRTRLAAISVATAIHRIVHSSSARPLNSTTRDQNAQALLRKRAISSPVALPSIIAISIPASAAHACRRRRMGAGRRQSDRQPGVHKAGHLRCGDVGRIEVVVHVVGHGSLAGESSSRYRLMTHAKQAREQSF